MTNQVTFPAMVDAVMTRRDRTLKIVFVTQEMSPEAIKNVFELRDKLGRVIFVDYGQAEVFVPNEPPLEFKKDKTSSQRLRNVLYVEWEQKRSSDAFEDYYRREMERIIEARKENLE